MKKILYIITLLYIFNVHNIEALQNIRSKLPSLYQSAQSASRRSTIYTPRYFSTPSTMPYKKTPEVLGFEKNPTPTKTSQGYQQSGPKNYSKKVYQILTAAGIGGATFMPFLFFSHKYDKHKVPSEMKKLLDSKEPEIANFFRNNYLIHDNYIFSWLPNYIIKTAVPGRLEGKEYCDEIIKKNPETMSLLETPKKYYYAANGHEYIIAEIVEGTIPREAITPESYLDKIKLWLERPQQLTLKQTIQLCNFIMESGWSDSRRDNYALRSNGHISIIDTQDSTFAINTSDKVRKEKGIQGLNVLLRSDQEKYFDQASKTYIQERIKKEMTDFKK